MTSTRVRVWTVAAAVLALAVAGVAQARSEAATGAEKVTLSDFKIAVAPRTATKGSVAFTVTNRGKLPHDFKIAGKKTARLSPGKTARLAVNLKPGRYAYLCTVTGHAAAGMKGVLTVK